MTDTDNCFAYFAYPAPFGGNRTELCYDMSDDGVWRSPASALAWGVRGPRFESGYPDSWKTGSPFGEPFDWKGVLYAASRD